MEKETTNGIGGNAPLEAEKAKFGVTVARGRATSQQSPATAPERATLSIAEACAIAGIRRTSLYKAIRAGELRAIKIGRRTFITPEDLLRWLRGMPVMVPKAGARALGM
jgi:excisionase family DNA binding protein